MLRTVMEFRQLQLFLAVMEFSSVTRAAEKMFLSPGAVSLQLHNLAGDLRRTVVRSASAWSPRPRGASGGTCPQRPWRRSARLNTSLPTIH